MATQVLDAYGLMVFFEQEPGYEKVEDILINALEKGNDLIMTSVNLGEVYYTILRNYGEAKALEVEKKVSRMPIEIIDVDFQIAKEAGRIKAFHKLSYADCIAAALSKLTKNPLITGDKEFKAIEDEIKIIWV